MGFAERVRKLGWWAKNAVIVTSGGWVLVLLWFILLPMKLITHETRGLVGILLGFSFALGTGVSATIYWLITGRNGLDIILGLRER
jgi:hypothetical protein